MTGTYNQLDNLSPEERALALEMLKQYSEDGSSQLYQDMLYEDYDEVPVPIHEFLHNRKYLGNALYDNEGRFTVFPYWEKKLEEIFPTNTTTQYNTIIFTGAIGLGKSTIAVICQLYLLYRLLCLKDPYLFYGLQPIDKISISLMNITLENAKGVALDKMNQMILSSEWFLAHGEMSGTTNLVYNPNKHIELITASSNNQVIGRALFCLSGNTEVVTSEGVCKLKDIQGQDKQFLTISPEGKVEYSKPCKVQPTKKTKEIYKLELEDGTILECTPEHRFLLKDGTYKEAQYLTEEDELMDTQNNGQQRKS